MFGHEAHGVLGHGHVAHEDAVGDHERRPPAHVGGGDGVVEDVAHGAARIEVAGEVGVQLHRGVLAAVVGLHAPQPLVSPCRVTTASPSTPDAGVDAPATEASTPRTTRTAPTARLLRVLRTDLKFPPPGADSSQGARGLDHAADRCGRASPTLGESRAYGNDQIRSGHFPPLWPHPNGPHPWSPGTLVPIGPLLQRAWSSPEDGGNATSTASVHDRLRDRQASRHPGPESPQDVGHRREAVGPQHRGGGGRAVPAGAVHDGGP